MLLSACVFMYHTSSVIDITCRPNFSRKQTSATFAVVFLGDRPTQPPSPDKPSPGEKRVGNSPWTGCFRRGNVPRTFPTSGQFPFPTSDISFSPAVKQALSK